MPISLETTVCSGSANSYANLATADGYLAGDHSLAAIWADLSDDEKGRLLISATRIMDREKWQGQELTSLFKGALGLAQALAFPRDDQEYKFGQAASGSQTSLADPSLAGHAFWPDDFFLGGSVVLTSGLNNGAITKIEGFSPENGELTLSSLAQAVSSGDRYFLIWPLDEKVVRACVEQAGHLHQSGASGLADMGSAGVRSASVDGLSLKFDGGAGTELCARARALLARYRISGPRLGRG